MADNRKLAQGLMMMTPSARADLAQREGDIQRGKTVELLRRAGQEMYDNPIVNTAIGFTPVLGDVQAAGETMAALNRGAPWQETAGYAAGMLPFVPMIGKTVWHGSPHTFDKFDLSKIGTGEGAQAYGHGLYLAEAPEVAKGYRAGKEGSEMNVFVGGKQFEPQTNAEKTAANLLGYETRTIGADPFARAEKYFVENIPDVNPETAKRYEDALQTVRNLREQGATLEGGNLYKVDLPDEQIAKMLDWDKPFSQQNETVREALKRRITDVTPTDNFDMGGNARLRDNRAGQIDPNSPSPWLMESVSQNGTSRFGLSQGDVDRMFGTKDVADLTGEQIISRLAQERGGQAQASAYLNELGIPGIQYLDQASRGAGEGTRNYVVFSDEIPQILERNGQPVAQALRDYRGSHTAPGPDFGAPLHDLTGGGQMYPEDVYSRNAVQYYGTGDTKLDKESFALAQRMRNKPEEMIDIYRAVPNEGNITSINAGDWVTINPNYAKQHGESNLPEGYKILQQKVPAKTVWTNADSIHEYGYWPE